ncbi:peptidyl-tRNA hydrolase ICT1, mitochondrial [Pararge aegeria]|uniref:Large ribosomal subunit protein mL62 n=1 Tax=Pararge aegeria aegeria TaxID=348720 RepID=A0A8S4RI38_9NEOP|nr:peptidyl-tRNA hydrolase ICT1, mitochondrial [Pararge aegeria]CAH2236496.1 jg21256 [Pararge aegeria aegeria]
MALIPLRMQVMRMIAQCGNYSTLLQRSMAYKSAISLETLYPNSSLKLSTPSFTPNPNEKFSGYIPMEKLEIKYSASSGPGGQNVNKVHTKVDLRFKLSEADWIPAEIRDKMIELHSNKLTKEGYLILRSDVTRTQQLNLADCLQKLRNMIRDAAVTKREPTPETEERIRQRQLKASRLRVAVKREDALRRAQRRAPTVVDL